MESIFLWRQLEKTRKKSIKFMGILVSIQAIYQLFLEKSIDDEFVVHDIKVIEGEKGLFIAMPSRKATDGEYRDIAHPINSVTRDRIQKMILDKYQDVMAEETDIQDEAAAE